MRWIWEPTSLFMLKFGFEIDFGMIQKGYAAIFEISIGRGFSGVEVQIFAILTNFGLRLPEKSQKIKI